MSFFDDVNLDAEITESGDYMGYTPPESDVYNAKIEFVYGDTSKGGAKFISIHAVSGTENFKFDIYVTSGTEKGCKTFYEDRKGNKRYLPGFELAQDLSRIVTGKALAELEVEEKQVMLWSYDENKKVPTKKNVLTAFTGAPIKLGVKSSLEDKYSDPSVSITRTELDKVFNAETSCTWAEMEAGESAGQWINRWIERNKGVTEDNRDVSKKDDGVANPFGDAEAATAAEGISENVEEDSPFA